MSVEYNRQDELDLQDYREEDPNMIISSQDPGNSDSAEKMQQFFNEDLHHRVEQIPQHNFQHQQQQQQQ